MKKICFDSELSVKQNQTGRSMIEMLGVLAIMAVITVLSIMAYTMAMSSVRVNESKNNIAIISQYIRELFPDADYSALNSYGNNAFKHYFIDTGLMDYKNPFGAGTLAVPGYYLRGGSNASYAVKNNFIVTVGGIKKQDCLKLKNMNWDNLVEKYCFAQMNDPAHWFFLATFN